MSSNITHQEASERSYLAAAHNESRSLEGRVQSLEKAQEMHQERTGTELQETLEKKDHGPQQHGLADTEQGRQERAFIAAAHRQGREEEKQLESLKKASELHEERTGEPLQEALDRGAMDSEKRDADKPRDGSEYEHLANQERAFIGAAHRKGRDEDAKNESLTKASEIHKERTGHPLAEAVAKGVDKDDSEGAHLEHQERSLIGAAHRKGRDEEGKKESLLKASEIHEKLTGEPLQEAVEKGFVDQDGDVINENRKRAHATESEESEENEKRQKLDQLTRQERAFIAASHRDGRSEEAKLESLRKANELHEKRTGASLSEAVERGVATE